LTREDITYIDNGEDKNPFISGYHEEYTDMYLDTIITDIKLNYESKNGRNVLVSSDSSSQIEDILATIRNQNAYVNYTYNKDGNLIDAVGTSTTEGNDLFENPFSSTRDDTYQIINGLPKLMHSYEITTSLDLFGSEVTTQSETAYVYDHLGLHLTEAEGANLTLQEDVFGTKIIIYEQNTYEIINGEPKLTGVITEAYEFDPYADVLTDYLTAGDLEYIYNEIQLLNEAYELPSSESIILAYRAILGRDPTLEELGYYLNQLQEENKDLPEIYQELIESEEYQQNANLIDSIVNGVSEWLSEFIRGPPDEQASLLQQLGLNIEEIVSLTTEAIEGIINWLANQTRQFASCAFNGLRTLLSRLGIVDTDYEDIATSAILIDILTGTINEETEGQLSISMYSLINTAELYDLTLYAGTVEFEYLQDLNQPVIAHLGENHWVVLNPIDEAQSTVSVTEANGENYTLDTEDFLGLWDGNIITHLQLPDEMLLSTEEMKLITGNGRHVYVGNAEQGFEAYVGWSGLPPLPEDIHRVFEDMEIHVVEWTGPDPYIWYHTWGGGAESKTEYDSVHRGGSGYVEIWSKSSEGNITCIHAKNIKEPGVEWADYWAKSKKEGDAHYSYTKARVERVGNTYNIDGLKYGAQGRYHAMIISLNRTIGSEGGSSNSKQGYVVSIDLDPDNYNMNMQKPTVHPYNGVKIGNITVSAQFDPLKLGFCLRVTYTIRADRNFTAIDGEVILRSGDLIGTVDVHWSTLIEGDTLQIRLEQDARSYSRNIGSVNYHYRDYSQEYNSPWDAPIRTGQRPITVDITISYPGGAGGDGEIIAIATVSVPTTQTYRKIRHTYQVWIPSQWHTEWYFFDGYEPEGWLSYHWFDDDYEDFAGIYSFGSSIWIGAMINGEWVTDEPWNNWVGQIDDAYGSYWYDWLERGHWETRVYYTYKWNAPTNYQTRTLARFKSIVDNSPSGTFTLNVQDIINALGIEDAALLATIPNTVSGTQTAKLISTAQSNVFDIEIKRNFSGFSLTQTLSKLKRHEDYYLPKDIDSHYNGLTGGLDYDANIDNGGEISADIPGAPSAGGAVGSSPQGVFTPEDERVIPGESPELIEVIINSIENRLHELGDFSIEVINGIVDWLKALGDNIINCATKALSGLFNLLNIDSSKEDIASTTILFDILFNRIPLEGEFLYTSAQALVEVAQAYDLALYQYIITMSELAKINWPFIAHVGGDHFVLVTEIRDGVVYLVESNEQEYQVPLEEFLSQWQGFILSPVKIDALLLLDATEGMPGLAVIPVNTNLPLNLPGVSSSGGTNLNSLAIISGNLMLIQPEYPAYIIGADPVNPVFRTTLGARGPPGEENSLLLSLQDPSLLELLALLGLEDIAPASYTSHTTSFKTYEYDEHGLLINVYSESTKTGYDIFGNYYTIETKENYQVVSGKPLLEMVERTTQGGDIFGNTYISIERLGYTYGDYTNPDTGRSSSLALIKVEQLEVSLGNITAAAELTQGQELFGTTFTAKRETTYEAFAGQALVKLSVTTREEEDIFGSHTITVTTRSVNYSWQEIDNESYYVMTTALITKEVSGRDVFGNSWLTVQASEEMETYGLTHIGNNQIWALTEYEEIFSLITQRTDLYGNTSLTTTETEYRVFRGKPSVVESLTTESGTSIFGNTTTSITQRINHYDWQTLNGQEYYVTSLASITTETSGFDIFGNTYSTTQSAEETEYYNLTEKDGRQYWVLTAYIQTVPLITQEADIFGNTSINTTESKYQVFYGKTMLVESISNREGWDLFGSYTMSTTLTENTYEEIKIDNQTYFNISLRTITTSSSGYDILGNVWETHSPGITQGIYGITQDNAWGLVEYEDTQSQVSIGLDLFGMSHTTTVENEYEILFGEPMVAKTTSIKEGIDLFGSFSSSVNVTENVYSEIQIDDKVYYNVVSKHIQVYSSGWDIFGNEWDTQQPEQYNLIYSLSDAQGETPNVWMVTDITDIIPMVIQGEDLFGMSYTETIQNEYEIRFGKPLVIQSEVTHQGWDIFGSQTTTTTITTYEHDFIDDASQYYPGAQGLSFYVTLSAGVNRYSCGSDIFGNLWLSTQPEGYSLVYAWSDDQEQGTGRYGWMATEINQVADMEIEGEDLFGITYTESISNTYQIKFGKPIVNESTVIHQGWDIFGSQTTTTTTTTYTHNLVHCGLVIDEAQGLSFYVTLSAQVSRSSSGYDIFGNLWLSTQPEGYSLLYGWSDDQEQGTGRYGWMATEINQVTDMEIEGIDLFGITYTETIQNEYEIRFGKPLVIQSEVTHQGWDIFGSQTTTTTITTYEHDFIDDASQYYPEAQDLSFYVTLNTEVSRSSSGYDIFGNEWYTLQPESYTIVYGWSDDQEQGTGRYGWMAVSI
ncbi:MAG: hypothetical protein AMJ78_00600, partial [Omnitrophica WOR_2 bacterium SM23_29]